MTTPVRAMDLAYPLLPICTALLKRGTIRATPRTRVLLRKAP